MPPGGRPTAGPPEDDVRVLVYGGTAGTRWNALLERSVLGVLRAEGIPTAEISVALLNDADIRSLNREHLGRDRPTDVLAFPLWADGEPVVGDVYLGLERARRQAKAEEVPLAEELVRLVIHGTLHVLGWDHPEESRLSDDSPMFRRQEELVRVVIEGEEG